MQDYKITTPVTESQTNNHDSDVNSIDMQEKEAVLNLLAPSFRFRANKAVWRGDIPAADHECFMHEMIEVALKALPRYDSSKSNGATLKTFLIHVVDKYLTDCYRKKKALKYKATFVAITTAVSDTDQDQDQDQPYDLISEEKLKDTSHYTVDQMLFRMDHENFLTSLTELEKLCFLCHLEQEMTFETIAKEIAKMSENTFRRKIWRKIQEKAIKYGGFEGKLIKL